MTMRHPRLLALAASLAVALAVHVASCRARRRAERGHDEEEPFLPLLFSAVGLGLTAAGVGAKVTGTDKKIEQKVWGAGGVADKATAGGGGAPTYVPSFVGRAWDGADWSCPAGTVETGSTDNSKACMSGQFAAPVWKQGGDGQWGHNCPAGTTPTPEAQWEKKCEVGWMGRILVNGKWQCPDGTADSGADWNKGLSWHDAQKQCKRSSAYTRRVQGTGGAWVCPPGTTDTKRTWGQPNGGNQCKWTGP